MIRWGGGGLTFAVGVSVCPNTGMEKCDSGYKFKSTLLYYAFYNSHSPDNLSFQ